METGKWWQERAARDEKEMGDGKTEVGLLLKGYTCSVRTRLAARGKGAGGPRQYFLFISFRAVGDGPLPESDAELTEPAVI